MSYFKRVNAQIYFLTFYIFGYSEQVRAQDDKNTAK